MSPVSVIDEAAMPTEIADESQHCALQAHNAKPAAALGTASTQCQALSSAAALGTISTQCQVGLTDHTNTREGRVG